MADIERLIENGWRPVPLAAASRGAGAPRGWQRREFSPPSFAPGCNIALRLDDLVVIDVDLNDPAKARLAERIALEVLGETPLIREREGSPRVALFYRAGGSICPRGGCVEVRRGSGAFQVAFGIHPAGGVYRWRGEGPEDVAAADLPAVDQASLIAALNAIDAALGVRRAEAPATKAPSSKSPGVGLVRDGRRALLRDLVAAEVGLAKRHRQPMKVEEVARRAWTRFAEQADLSRPKGRGRGYYKLADAMREARYVLNPKRLDRIKPAKGGSGWTLAHATALLAIIEADRSLSPADLAVARRLLAFAPKIMVSAERLGADLGLHPKTVMAARAKLIRAGYFRDLTSGRAGLRRRRLVIEPARDLVAHVSMTGEAIAEEGKSPVGGVVPPTPAEAVSTLIAIGPAWRRACFGFMRRRVEERVADCLDAGWTVERLAKLDPAEGWPIILCPDGRAPNIRLARHAVGLSQSGLADLLGVSQGTISKLERGQFQLPPDMAARLQQILPEAA